eukprot:95739_1
MPTVQKATAAMRDRMFHAIKTTGHPNTKEMKRKIMPVYKNEFIKYFESYPNRNCSISEFNEAVEKLYGKRMSSVLEEAISAIVKSHKYHSTMSEPKEIRQV